MSDNNLATTNGEPVDKVRQDQQAQGNNGQYAAYIILNEEERKKGFVRPFRTVYQHVGVRPRYSTVPVSNAEMREKYGYVEYERYPDDCPEKIANPAILGRYWTFEDLHSGCGSETRMGRELSETYARNPKFYGSTFCVKCNKHFPVEQFIWVIDGERVGS